MATTAVAYPMASAAGSVTRDNPSDVTSLWLTAGAGLGSGIAVPRTKWAGVRRAFLARKSGFRAGTVGNKYNGKTRQPMRIVHRGICTLTGLRRPTLTVARDTVRMRIALA